MQPHDSPIFCSSGGCYFGTHPHSNVIHMYINPFQFSTVMVYLRTCTCTGILYMYTYIYMHTYIHMHVYIITHSHASVSILYVHACIHDNPVDYPGLTFLEK